MEAIQFQHLSRQMEEEEKARELAGLLNLPEIRVVQHEVPSHRRISPIWEDSPHRYLVQTMIRMTSLPHPKRSKKYVVS